MADIEVNSIPELLSVLDEEGIGTGRHAHIRFWFRGQSTHGLKLLPGVYRPAFKKARDDANRLNTEQHLTQDFRIQSSGLRLGRNSYAEIYFLQQHYKMPTRLLDWTTSPLAALYFAVSHSPTADAELFWMDAYQLAITQGVPEDVFRGLGSQRNKYFEDALKPIFDFGNLDEFPDFIIPVRPDYMDTRVNSQSSCFTFHVPKRPALTIDENRTLRSLKIPAASKAKLQKELFLLGVDPFSIFGDLESLSSRLRAAYSV